MGTLVFQKLLLSQLCSFFVRVWVNHPNTVSPYFECLEAYGRNCKNMSNILIIVFWKKQCFLELNRVENMCFVCFGFHLLGSQLGMETDKTQLLGCHCLLFFSTFCCTGLDRFLEKIY